MLPRLISLANYKNAYSRYRVQTNDAEHKILLIIKISHTEHNRPNIVCYQNTFINYHSYYFIYFIYIDVFNITLAYSLLASSAHHTFPIALWAPPTHQHISAETKSKPLISLCTSCNQADESVAHVLIDCVNHAHARDLWGVSGLRDMWKRPAAVTGFLGEAGWPIGFPARR